MDIFESIEFAKKSKYGVTWFSEKGPINISKEGILTPIKLRELPRCKDEQPPEASDCKDGIQRDHTGH